jgi:hypothetical protein
MMKIATLKDGLCRSLDRHQLCAICLVRTSAMGWQNKFDQAIAKIRSLTPV